MKSEVREREKMRQGRALNNLLTCLRLPSQQQMAEATGISKSVLSRAISGQTLMSRGNRLKLARYLGERCETEQEVERVLRETGWHLDSEEWGEVRQYMLKGNTPMHGVPYLPEGMLVRRPGVLEALEGRLKAPRRGHPHLVVVQGMAGVGKTTLVNQVVRSSEIKERYRDGIYWLRMEGQADDREAVEKLAGVVTDFAGTMKQDPWMVVQEALKLKEVLVVLDGVSVPIDLSRWRAAMPRFGDLVVTTRRTDLGPAGQRVHIPPMKREEAEELLTRGVAVDIERAELEWLLENLAGLPLALAIVNAVAQWEKGFGQLIEELREEIITALEIGQTKDRSARLAFELSYRRLEDRAARLFRSLVISPQPFDDESMAHVLDWSSTATGKAFRTLVQMGLVEVEEAGRYRTHRLLHEYAAWLSEEQDAQLLPEWRRRFTVYYLEIAQRASELWDQGQEQEALQSWQRALEHIERGCSYAAALKRPDWVLGYLQSTNYYLGSRGLTGLINRWQRRFEEVVKGEDEAWMWGNISLGDAHLLLERPQAALDVLERARQTAKKVENEQVWFNATVKLAQALLAVGQLEDALALTRDESFTAYVSGLTVDDSLSTDAWALVGMMEKMAGRYDEAHDYLLRAWKSIEGDRKETSYWTQARVLLELGNVMMALGNYEDGLDFFERGGVVARDRGYDSLWRYHTLNAIRVLTLLDRVEEAEDRLNDLRRETTEEDDFAPWILLAEAEVTWGLGDHRAAEETYREAAEQFAGALVATDIWVILATRLEGIGQTDRAAEVWRRARESGRRTGNQHKYLIATLAYAKYLLTEDQKDEAHLLLGELVECGADIAPELAVEARELLGMEEEAGDATQTDYNFLAIKRDGEWQA